MAMLRSLLAAPFWWVGFLLGFVVAPFVCGFLAGYEIMGAYRKLDIANSEREAVRRGWMKPAQRAKDE